MKKRILPILLILCMLISLFSLQGLAAKSEEDISVYITGKARVGSTLTADLSNLLDESTAVIQWQKKDSFKKKAKVKNVRNGEASIVLKKKDEGDVFRIVVRETKDSKVKLVSEWTKAVKPELLKNLLEEELSDAVNNALFTTMETEQKLEEEQGSEAESAERVDRSGTTDPAGGTDPAADISLDKTEIIFSSIPQDYITAPVEQTVVVSNNSTEKVKLIQPVAENFQIGNLSAEELASGETASFTIQPKIGLLKGVYEEVVSVATDKGQELGVKVGFTVTDTAVYSIELDKSGIIFEDKSTGYLNAPAAQTVVVTNTGNTTIHLIQPQSQQFEIGQLTKTELAAGDTAAFTIQPPTGLEYGSYEDTISVTTEEAANASVQIFFRVNGNNFMGIIKPDPVKAENGRAKTAKSLGLPAKIKINTTKGIKKVPVKWFVGQSEYNRNKVDKQKFYVTGKITLPENVSNADSLSLKTKIRVIVKAYAPKAANASNNRITMIDEGGKYHVNCDMTFQAIGSGMNRTKPKKGDVRYLPSVWNVGSDNYFGNQDYKGTFRCTAVGNYKLQVTFVKQIYDGNQWNSDGVNDMKSVNFSIVDPYGYTSSTTSYTSSTTSYTSSSSYYTPSTTSDVFSTTSYTSEASNEGNDSGLIVAAKTDDQTPILPWVMLLFGSIVCSGFFFASQQRRL